MHYYLLQILQCTCYLHPFCGSATLAQVLQDSSEEFENEMNCEVIASTLCSRELIPARLKRAIDQSVDREDANTKLIDHLKANVKDVQIVREILEVAANKKAYSRMNAFAKDMLERLPSVQ